MAHKKSYSRYFIILQEDEKGYSLAHDKQPSGYTKIEMKNDKCKVSYYIQNLKSGKDPYYMILICNKKDVNKLINIGMLNIDDNGRADISYECNMNNIEGTGIDSDKIGGAAIVKKINGKLIVPMSGFASTDIPNGWKNYALVEIDQKRTEEVKEETKEELKEELKVTVPKQEEILEEQEKEEVNKTSQQEEEVSNPIKEEKEATRDAEVEDTEKALQADAPMEKDEESNIFDEYEDNIEKSKETDNVEHINEEVFNDAKYSENEEEFKEEFHEDYRDDHKKDQKENYKEEKKYPIGSVGEFFENVADGFEEIKDVSPDIKMCRWYKVPVKDLDVMCNISNYNKYTVVYYPMINYYPYIKKHGHYMIGYKCDKNGKMKYIVYAIPGTKDKADQPYGGKSGFVTWIPSKSNKYNPDYGYWLMFYDFRNSIVVVPMK